MDGGSLRLGEMPAPSIEGGEPGLAEARAAPRYTLLIRTAKLVSQSGEFVCVIRDVSATGISLKLFHSLPPGDPYELHMPDGTQYAIHFVWERDEKSGFSFEEPVDLEALITERRKFPKRGLRLDVCFPARLIASGTFQKGRITNLSQQGARLESDAHLAIDQTVMLEPIEPTDELRQVRAKVRWRRGSDYGLVFDDTFSLANYARLVARLQAPHLLTTKTG